MFFCLSGKGTEARGHWSVASLSGRQLQSADTCSMSRPRSKGTADVERNTSPPSPLRAEIPELSDFLSSKPGAGQNITCEHFTNCQQFCLARSCLLNSFGLILPIPSNCSRDSLLVQRRTRGRKVASWNPRSSKGENLLLQS